MSKTDILINQKKAKKSGFNEAETNVEFHAIKFGYPADEQ